jgi:hypothetical protein
MKGMVSPVSLLLHGGLPCPDEDKPETAALRRRRSGLLKSRKLGAAHG